MFLRTTYALISNFLALGLPSLRQTALSPKSACCFQLYLAPLQPISLNCAFGPWYCKPNMEVAVSSTSARRRLAQVPELHQKVEAARKKLERNKPHDQDGQIAAAEARVQGLQATVPVNIKLSAYSDKGGLLSSASKYASKRLTFDDVKALLHSTGQQAAHNGVPDVAASPGQHSDSATEAKNAPSEQQFAAGEAHIAQDNIDATPSGCSVTKVAAAPVSMALCSTAHAVSNPAAAGSKSVAFDVTCADSAATVASADTVTCNNSNAHSTKAAKSSICRASRRSSTCSEKSTSGCRQQKQHHLQQADELFQKINAYVAGEVPLHQYQQLQAAGAPHTSSYTSGSFVDQVSSMRTIGSLASIPEERSAACWSPEGPQIDAEGWTSELLSSLALRFQEYGQPMGGIHMPDLATMIRVVQQQEQVEIQQRQQQQQQWVHSQQIQQQATRAAANRHLQLYQLGVQQQVDRSHTDRNRGGRLIGPTLQHVGGAHKGNTTQTLQQARQIQQNIQQGRDQGPIDGVGQHTNVQVDSSGDKLSNKEGDTDSAAAVAAGGKQCQGPDGATDSSVGLAVIVSSTHAVHLPVVTSVEAAHEAFQPATATAATADVITADTAAGQEPSSQSITQEATGLEKVVSTGTLGQMNSSVEYHMSCQNSSYTVRCPGTRYKCDIPGVPVGASHGHTSPTGLTFKHLPGSRRQVYAQVQDALAFSNALTTAERALGALKYAPAGACGGHSC